MLRTSAHDDPLSFAASLTADTPGVHALLEQQLAAYSHGLVVSDEAGALVACSRMVICLMHPQRSFPAASPSLRSMGA